MCDRITAIQYVITNRFGSKAELKSRIHGHYDILVSTGFIYEPAVLDDDESGAKGIVRREWVATSLAYRRADILGIKKDKKLRLKLSPAVPQRYLFFSKLLRKIRKQ